MLTDSSLTTDISKELDILSIKDLNDGCSTGQKSFGSGPNIESFSPVDGAPIAQLSTFTREDYDQVITVSREPFKTWRTMPAPRRGEIVRQFGQKLREYRAPLGKLVSYEMGKSLQEGLGEVQEMIDICDFAVGLSRQLYGLTMHSERPLHRMYEQYHPSGTVGV